MTDGEREYFIKMGKEAWLDTGHEWELDEDGGVDIFAYSNGGGTHNGPRCKLCGYGACWHCVKKPKACKGD